MAILTPEEALQKRDQLVNDGFCTIPGVMSGSFLEEMRRWTDQVLDATPVPHKQRYQGSDIHVVSERRFEKEGLPREDAQHSPMVDRLTDLPSAWEACRLIGLEGQAPHDYAIILSKPPGGPALYWHQDWMNWNSPASMTPWPTTIFISYYLTDTTREKRLSARHSRNASQADSAARSATRRARSENAGLRRNARCVHGSSRCGRCAVQSRRSRHQRRARFARRLAQPKRAAPHAGFAMAFGVSLSDGAVVVDGRNPGRKSATPTRTRSMKARARRENICGPD